MLSACCGLWLRLRPFLVARNGMAGSILFECGMPIAEWVGFGTTEPSVANDIMSGKITALRAQGGRRNRVSIFLDGEYAFDLQSILAANLHRGQELTQGEIDQLRQRDAVEHAYERALHYLSFRPRSELEVRRYLQQRGVASASIDLALARLQSSGLVDDTEFARFWVDNREAFRPRGRWALRTELWQKGIASEIIESVVADINEETSAMNAARPRARRLGRLDEGTFRRRLLGFLRRRGFDSEVSLRVASRLWDESGSQRETDPEQRAWPDDR